MEHGSQTLCLLAFLGSTGLSAATWPWAVWETGFVFTAHRTEEQQKPPQFPASLSHCPGGIGVWDHTLFICGSFKWCPETHISCLFESVYVTGEAVKQQSAFTPVVYLFSYMSACSSLSHNSLLCLRWPAFENVRGNLHLIFIKISQDIIFGCLYFSYQRLFVCLFKKLSLITTMTSTKGRKKEKKYPLQRKKKKYKSSQNKLKQIPWKCWKQHQDMQILNSGRKAVSHNHWS